MESPQLINLSWRSSIDSNASDTMTFLSGTSSPKSSKTEKVNGNAPVLRDSGWLKECKAAYLGIKQSVSDDIQSIEELTRALQHAGFNPSRRTLEQYWPNNTTSMTFAHFCDFVELENNKDCTDPFVAFQKLDKESSGKITFKELRRFMTTKGEKMSDEEFHKIFETIPFVEDGQFDYKSFCDSVAKTAETCRTLSLEASESREKEFTKNSNTFIIRKKNGTKSLHRRSSSSLSENGSIDALNFNFKDWPKTQSKGCFYYDEGTDAVVSHQFVLELPEPTNVWLTIEPIRKFVIDSDSSHMLIYILKEGDSTAKQLVAFTENRDENGRYFLGTRLEAGKYFLLPFTPVQYLKHSNGILMDEEKLALVEQHSDKQVALTSIYKKVLEDVFSIIDLDGNGRLSRQEFTLFQWRTCGEEVQDDEWAALEATFELEDGELTLNGFIDAHLLEAENNLGNPEELWTTLHAMGYDGKLKLRTALPFLLEIYTEEPNPSLCVSALKMGGALLERTLCRCVVDRGRSSKVRNLNDLIMYTYVAKQHAIIAVHNKAHSKVAVRLDCTLSQNCSSHRGRLDFTLECLPKSLMIGHHLVPACVKEPWSVSCVESVVK